MEWWLFGYLIGHVVALKSPILIGWVGVLVLSLSSVVLLIYVMHTSARGGKNFIRALSGILFSFVWVFLYGNLHFSQTFIQQANKVYSVEGQVASILVDSGQPKASSTNVNFDLILNKVDGIHIQSNLLFTPKIRLNWRSKNIELKQGDVVSLTAKLNLPSGYENQYGFNFTKWLFANQVIARGYVKKFGERKRTTVTQSQRVVEQLYFSNEDKPYIGHVIALGTAFKGLVNEQQKRLQHMGISHLFAISGLHIGILFVLINMLLKLCFYFVTSSHKHSLLLLLSLSFLWFYVGLIGFVISATRAALLVSIWMLTTLVAKNLNRFSVLLLVAVLSLLSFPTAILNASWWLSFGAVLGILLFIQLVPSFEHSTDEFENSSKIHFVIKRTFASILTLVCFQVFILIWMVPISVYWFAGFSVSAFITNLLAVPLFSFLIIPLVFLWTGQVILFGNSLVSDAIYHCIEWLLTHFFQLFSNTDMFAKWINIANDVWLYLVLSIVLFMAFILTRNNKPLILMSVPLIFLFPVATKVQTPLETYLFDVGQGTSVLFKRANRGFLYDLGPIYPSGFSATQAVVKPMLVGLGHVDIELLIISHQDNDHKGDYRQIWPHLERANTKQYLVSCPQHEFIWQQVRIEPLWPKTTLFNNTLSDSTLSDNDGSCVLKLTDLTNGVTILLTGDISKKIEKKLVQLSLISAVDINADVLFSAHHGSKYSSSSDFLKAVSPDWVLHSAGVNNRFNFPTKEVQQRVKMVGSKQLTTNEAGMIKFIFNPQTDQIEVHKQLRWSTPFWKRQNPFSINEEIR